MVDTIADNVKAVPARTGIHVTGARFESAGRRSARRKLDGLMRMRATLGLALSLVTATAVQAELEDRALLTACGAHGLAMVEIASREIEQVGVFDAITQTRDAGDLLYNTMLSVWGDQTACAVPFENADGPMREQFQRDLIGYDATIAAGESVSNVRRDMIAAFRACGDDLGITYVREVAAGYLAEGLPCGWGQ